MPWESWADAKLLCLLTCNQNCAVLRCVKGEEQDMSPRFYRRCWTGLEPNWRHVTALRRSMTLVTLRSDRLPVKPLRRAVEETVFAEVSGMAGHLDLGIWVTLAQCQTSQKL